MDPSNDFCICGNTAAEHDSHPAYIQTHALFLDSKFEVFTLTTARSSKDFA
jgi:hypothetical protein